MGDAQVHKVRLEPVGVEMDVEEGETVLEAAFRQGIALMHGCKEGQCGSCKSRLISGDIELPFTRRLIVRAGFGHHSAGAAQSASGRS